MSTTLSPYLPSAPEDDALLAIASLKLSRQLGPAISWSNLQEESDQKYVAMPNEDMKWQNAELGRVFNATSNLHDDEQIEVQPQTIKNKDGSIRRTHVVDSTVAQRFTVDEERLLGGQNPPVDSIVYSAGIRFRPPSGMELDEDTLEESLTPEIVEAILKDLSDQDLPEEIKTMDGSQPHEALTRYSWSLWPQVLTLQTGETISFGVSAEIDAAIRWSDPLLQAPFVVHEDEGISNE